MTPAEKPIAKWVIFLKSAVIACQFDPFLDFNQEPFSFKSKYKRIFACIFITRHFWDLYVQIGYAKACHTLLSRLFCRC